MAVTITDIASKLGISHSTVSLVLNGKAEGRVSQKTAEKIKKLTRRMGYRTNMAAVGLRNQKSYVIGILLPSLRDSFQGELAASLQHRISKTEYIASFGFWETMEEAERSANNLLSRQVDAIITCEPGFLPDNLDLPVVAIYNYDERFDYIGYNYDHSIQLRLDYLVELGHRKIAYLGKFHNPSQSLVYKKIIKKWGLPYLVRDLSSRSNFYETDWANYLADGFDALWDGEVRPTALLAQNDTAALLILRRAWERGIKVPDDLSVIGVDNIRQSATSIPGLTTVDNFADISVGEMILERIFSRLQDRNLPINKYVATSELIKRESCFPPQ